MLATYRSLNQDLDLPAVLASIAVSYVETTAIDVLTLLEFKHCNNWMLELAIKHLADAGQLKASLDAALRNNLDPVLELLWRYHPTTTKDIIRYKTISHDDGPELTYPGFVAHYCNVAMARSVLTGAEIAVNEGLLQIACRCNSLEVTVWLCTAYPDLAVGVVHTIWYIPNGPEKVAKLRFLKDHCGLVPMQHDVKAAICWDTPELVRFLINECGLQLEPNSLAQASEHRNRQVVRLLIQEYRVVPRFWDLPYILKYYLDSILARG